MRIAAVLAVVLTPLLSFGQSNELPDVLKPDHDLMILAENGGFEVAKILPRGTFEGRFNAYKDEENPLGIREGGSFYSFSTRQHSYNKVPQIMLENGMISVGFYGLSYGFMAELGDVSLDSVNLDIPAVKFLFEYRPPLLTEEVRAAAMRVHRFANDGVDFARRFAAKGGGTYVLRAISFEEADKFVAFKILRIDNDGAITIGWRSLEDFEIPHHQGDTDESLAKKVAILLKDNRYVGTQFSVGKGIITLRGFPRNSVNDLARDLQGLKPRGISLSHAPIAY